MRCEKITEKKKIGDNNKEMPKEPIHIARKIRGDNSSYSTATLEYADEENKDADKGEDKKTVQGTE